MVRFVLTDRETPKRSIDRISIATKSSFGVDHQFLISVVSFISILYEKSKYLRTSEDIAWHSILFRVFPLKNLIPHRMRWITSVFFFQVSSRNEQGMSAIKIWPSSLQRVRFSGSRDKHTHSEGSCLPSRMDICYMGCHLFLASSLVTLCYQPYTSQIQLGLSLHWTEHAAFQRFYSLRIEHGFEYWLVDYLGSRSIWRKWSHLTNLCIADPCCLVVPFGDLLDVRHSDRSYDHHSCPFATQSTSIRWIETV